MDDPRLSEIQALVEPILAAHEMELVALSCHPHGGQLLVRLLVDKVGGVSLQQCATVNQRIGAALEAANAIEGSYTIEVSSPGLDRPLVSKRDFERALGEKLTLSLATDDGRSKDLQGMLLAVQPEAIVVKTIGGNLTVPIVQVRLAKKVVRW